jgi:hypothetical protein
VSLSSFAPRKRKTQDDEVTAPEYSAKMIDLYFQSRPPCHESKHVLLEEGAANS